MALNCKKKLRFGETFQCWSTESSASLIRIVKYSLFVVILTFQLDLVGFEHIGTLTTYKYRCFYEAQIT